MLKIAFKKQTFLDMGKSEVFFVSSIFENEYTIENLEDNFPKRVIKEIDKSTVINYRTIDSPVLGLINPYEIANGSKVLILMDYLDENWFFLSRNLGNNCIPLLLEIAKRKDIYLVYSTALALMNEHFQENDIFSVEQNRMLKSHRDMIRTEIDVGGDWYVE